MSSPHPIPARLYHTTLAIVSPQFASPHSPSALHPVSTYPTLRAADSGALAVLPRLGRPPSSFSTYSVRSTDLSWPHGPNIIVRAVSPSGREVDVRVEETNNPDGLAAGENGAQGYHYVLRRETHYDQWNGAGAGGLFERTWVVGCYGRRAEADKAARECLGGQEWAQYDVMKEWEEVGWPFGKEVVVRAVAPTGEDNAISVRAAVRDWEEVEAWGSG